MSRPLSCLTLLLLGCVPDASAPSSPGAGAGWAAKGEADDGTVAVDLAQHPPAVEDIAVEIVSEGRTDNAWLYVTYADGAGVGERVTLSLDGGTQTLNDLGVKPDQKAGDGIYTGTITFDLADYVERHAAYVEAAGDLGVSQVGRFDGLTRLESAALDLSVVGPNLDGEPVDVDLTDPVGTVLTLFSGGGALLAATTDPEATIAVRDVGVAYDRSRTGVWQWDGSQCSQVGNPDGVWGFTYLMDQINAGGGNGITTQDFIESWLRQFNTPQIVNGQQVHIDGSGFRDLWNSIPFLVDDMSSFLYTDTLDLDQLPVQLIAITNRLDVRDAVAYGGAGGLGELRFVFALVDPGTCEPLMGNFILEYGVPVEDCDTLRTYAQGWYDLDALTVGSAAYNQALEDITESVVPAGMAPLKPNGSAINQIRSNELEFTWGHSHYPNNNWDLKEFILPSDGAHLAMSTIAMTPGYGYELPNHTTEVQPIDDFIDTYTSDILGNTYTVDLTYPGTSTDPFRGAYAPYGLHIHGISREWTQSSDYPANATYWWLADPMRRQMFWGSRNVSSYEARHVFSINTCSGCHASETIEPGGSVTGATADLPFQHIALQVLGQPAYFSRFLTGTMDGCTTPDGLIAPLGSEVCTATCCPIGDPAFTDQVAQYHYDELERRAQDLEHLVTEDCATLIGVDWLNDAITQAAH